MFALSVAWDHCPFTTPEINSCMPREFKVTLYPYTESETQIKLDLISSYDLISINL